MQERKQIRTSVQSGSAVPWHSRGVVHGSLIQSVMFNHYNQLSQNVTKSVYCRITILLHLCPHLHIILKKRNDNSGTFRAIATEKCISHKMAKKCAGSGLLFMHLQLAFQRDGVHACYDVLSEEIYNKPRVTKHKVLISKQKIAISNTNYFWYININTHSAIYSI